MEPTEEYTYFMPGELFFLLSHTDPQRIDLQFGDQASAASSAVQSSAYKGKSLYDQIVDDLVEESNKRGISRGLELIRRKERELHFSVTREPENPPEQAEKREAAPSERQRTYFISKPPGGFSLIPVDVRLPAERRRENNREGYVDQAELVDLMLELDDDMRNNHLLDQEIVLQAVTLNWLSSPGSEWGGGGGPGGLPEPYQPDPMHPEHVPFRFDIPDAQNLLALPGAKKGEGVTVAILDTAPCPHDLAAAYERHHKVNPQSPREEHPLVDSLLAPDGPLTVHPASLEDLYRMRAVHLRDHNYQMTDHGLFVAGIIHTIAPKAQIHLFEVLNPDGVGDLLSIAKGLWQALNLFSGKPLVINCSLVLNIPLWGQPVKDLDPKLLAKTVDPTSLGNSKYLPSVLSDKAEFWLARQGQAIQWICDELEARGSGVIAAAGNDWKEKENKSRPSARFPAAFDSAVGVGALPKDAQPVNGGKYSPSSYSNISDRPKEIGITTLGGEPGENNGVLGVYIGKFPPMEFWLRRYNPIWRPFLWVYFGIRWGSFYGPQNKNDWAWWAGTSFATPIVTGVVAAVLSDLSGAAGVETAVSKLYTTQSIKNGMTLENEDVIEKVKQV